MTTLPRLIPALLITGLLLAGCAHQEKATRATRPSTTSTSTSSSSTRTTETRSTHHAEHAASTRQTGDNAKLPDSTGVAACDDYLSSYLACHRAAGIYAPDQLEYRYEAMRTSLLRDSQKPDVRPQLAARCNSLAAQLRQALHGKSCAENAPAPAGTP
jgi:hypothetical protein